MKNAKQIYIIILLLCLECGMIVRAGNLVVGDYGGDAGVSMSGAAVYSIPIECPIGVNDMKPGVSLVYNSQGGLGNAGLGWSLRAGSVIMKTCATPYYDEKALSINDESADYLTLDGQRLIKYKTLGNDETEFRTENDCYDRIVRKGQNLNYTFTVYTTTGRKLTYKQLKEGRSWYYGNLGWYLTEEEDLWGNYMTYEYWVNSVEEREWNIDEVRLSAICYGGNRNTGTKHVCKIKFTYDYTPSTNIVYYLGGYKKCRRRQLSEVSTFSNDVLNDRYVLKYKKAAKGDCLTSITRYGNNGDNLKSVEVEWNNDNMIRKEQVQTQKYLVGHEDFTEDTGYPNCDINHNFSNKVWFPVDYNNDGVTDMVSFSTVERIGICAERENVMNFPPLYGTYFQFFKSNHGKFEYDGYAWAEIDNKYSVNDRKFGGVLSGSFINMNERISILPCMTDKKELHLVNIRNPKDYCTIPINAKMIPLYAYTDLNKDGYDDIVVAGLDMCYIIWGCSATNLSNFSSKNIVSRINLSSKGNRLVLNDINADGLTDIMIVSNEGYTVLENKGTTESSGVCDFYICPQKKDLKFNPDEGNLFAYGDFNHDGVLDFMKTQGHDYVYYYGYHDYGNGAHRFGFNASRSEWAYWKDKDETSFAFAMDYNSDGTSDVAMVWNDFIQFNNHITVGKSSSKISERTLFMGDFNGDGREEIITLGYSLLGSGKNANAIYVTSLGSENAETVKKITTPFRQYRFVYAPLTDPKVYKKTQSISKLKVLSDPLFVVKNMYCDDDVYYEYSYKDALFEPTGKGFLGFLNITKEDFYGETSFTNKYSLNPAVVYPSETSISSEGTIAKKQKFSYAFPITAGKKAYFMQLNSEVDEDVLKGTKITKSWSNYTYGKPSGEKITYDNKTSEQYSCYNGQSVENYNITLWKNKDTNYKNEQGSITDKTVYNYTKLKPSKIVTHSGTNLAVTTNYSYDKFGNMITEKISAKNCETRTTTYTYSGSGRSMISRKEFDGGVTTYEIDEELGRLKSKTYAIGGTSYKTTYDTYDGFNHCLKKTLPDGRACNFKLFFFNEQKAKYATETSLTGSPKKKIYYDGMGQVIRETSSNFDGHDRGYFYEYDDRGLLIMKSFPCEGFTPSYPYMEEREYDDFGRIINIFEYGKGNTKYTYDGLTTTIQSPMGKKVLQYNAAGWLMKSTENGKSVTFTYYPNGLVKSSTASGLTTTMTYDVAGNRISVDDPDVGLIKTEYDAYGRKISETNENGDLITFSYDDKGRLKEQNDDENKFSFSYNSRNLLKKETSDDYSCEYTYDNYNRLTLKKETVGGSIFNTKYAYAKKYGKATTITYPSGETLKNVYDGCGYLTKVSFQNKTIWKPIKLDSKGNLIQDSLYKVNRLFTYNQADQLTQEKAVCGSTKLMDLSYTYSNVLMTGKKDNVYSNEEKYEYDTQKRLSKVNIKNTQKGTSLSGVMSYDELNNQTKTYDNHWDEIAYNKHQVSYVKIPAQDILYQKRYVYFDAYRMPSNVQLYSRNMYFSYRPDHSRYMTKEYNMGNLISTKYYLGDYEKEVKKDGKTREIHYLCGDKGLAAIYVKTDEKDTLFAAVVDRQNSLSAIMNTTTKKVERYSYKPWGMRRNAEDWTAKIQEDEPSRFSRGYCMHEHLPVYGLVNMGGRMYDVHLNQFISPDPNKQNPESWLNQNRYAYCVQNPIMYTDPSGNLYEGVKTNFIAWAEKTLVSNMNVQSVNNGLMSYGANQTVSGLLLSIGMNVEAGLMSYGANQTVSGGQLLVGGIGYSLSVTTTSNTQNTVSSSIPVPSVGGKYDQEHGDIILGLGKNSPFSDSYNSSTARNTWGMIDFSWMPTGFSTTSKFDFRIRWMYRFNQFAMLKQLTSDRFASIYDINTNQSTITSRVDQYTNSGWKLKERTRTFVGEGGGDPNNPSMYDTTDVMEDYYGHLDTVIHESSHKQKNMIK